MMLFQWLARWMVVASLLLVVVGEADYGEEVNAPSQWKFKTVPDGTMSPTRDFGYIGLSTASIGPGFERDFNQTHRDGEQPTEGWPEFNPRQTFAGLAGFFDRQANTTKTNYPELLDRGDESVISGIPHFTGIYVSVGEHVLNASVDPSTISDYNCTMNFQDGILQWNYTWTPSLNASSSFQIEYTVFTSRARVNVAATQLIITPLSETTENITVTDILDGRSAVRSFLGQKGVYNDTASIYVSNHPNGLQDISAWTVSTANFSSGPNYMSSRAITLPLKYGQPRTFRKNATRDGWDLIVAEHIAVWNQDMQREKITSYRNPVTGRLPVNDTLTEVQQISAVIDTYMLLQTLLKNDTNLNNNGVSVGGLTADPYAGMYFWDMEIWMFPGIVMSHPEYALQMVNYRLKMHEQAKANAQEAYVQEKYKLDNDSVLYSWTSGRYGNATGTGPTLDYEYHINTDVAKAMLDYRQVTSDEQLFRQKMWPAVESVGHTIEGLLQKDDQGKWNIWNMTDPDEWANHVKNGAFTQASFFQILSSIISIKKQYNEMLPSTWLDIVENIAIPVSSSGITLEYDNMPSNITIKQADVTLLLYPLSLPESSKAMSYTLERKQADLRYHTQRQSLDGPAMTFAINNIATLRYGPSGCSASTYNKMAVIANRRAPWFLMSEQTNDDPNANGGYPPAFPFLTGHGGTLQIPLYGNLGLDTSQDFLTIQPTLSPPTQYLAPPTFQFKGHKFKASMNTTHTNITFIEVSPYSPQNTTSVPLIQNLPASRHPQEIHTLFFNQTLTLENDMYWQDLTTPNNLIQCLPIIKSDAIELNRWPQSINDGDVGTSWQPESTVESSVSIDTSSVKGERVKAINVVWGQRVPTSALVMILNSNSSSNFSEGHMFTLPLPDFDIEVLPNVATINDIDSLADLVSSEDSPEGDGEKDAGDEVKIEDGYKTTYTLPDDKVVYMGDTVVLQISGCIGTSCGVFGDVAGATVEAWEIIGEA
ncbi:glycoside hydrolase family 65 protein [Sclerotinia borealis F-4128]|uniref:alpha,alpha-trehalase n=1 Tax=Sclerotinia borealis (strain F-4128) TaxID=1432307 RepID=W9CHJ2_SCLBF|nr:glycoside hydrolase family 65 protein [Sclerotinia borealis F-4128]